MIGVECRFIPSLRGSAPGSFALTFVAETPTTPVDALRLEVGRLADQISEAQLALEAMAGPAIDAVIDSRGHVHLLRRALTELQQSDHQFRTILDHASDAIVVRDLEHRIAYWNKGAEKIYGWTAAEAMGRDARELHVSDPEAFQRSCERVLGDGEWTGEVKPRTKSGRAVVLQCRSTLICDEGGRPKSILLINTDITERKRLETQFLRAQRLESIGSLASGVAHDLNNILTPIRMATGLLKLKLDPADEQGQRLLSILETNALRGAHLVRQVLGFSRGYDGEEIAIHPAQVAREVAQIVTETFPKSIHFARAFAEDLWTVAGDPTHLHQVILNLCLNARDAMPAGGRLTLGLRNEVIGGCNYVVISVADTGCGIPPALRERIFEPFFTTKEKDQGTGLGLSTVQGIVQALGGFIEVESREDEGSTFIVRLPADAAAESSADRPNAEAGWPRGSNQLILVADDEDPIRLVASNILERFGYRVLLAENGAQAISLFAVHREDIAAVLTDMAMPVMDGAATIRALRDLDPAVKIIGSSGDGSATEPGAAGDVGLGVTQFIAKPYAAETLLKTVASVLAAG
jgi:PAS domain S-box-containing protein